MSDEAAQSENAPTTYDRLVAEFEVTFQDTRGGFTFDYITGEQVTSRLNEVLGPGGWSFRVLEHAIHAEADECWALGELTAVIDGQTVTRQQFGSQKVKRSRSSGTPLDIGFDLKGAATDALKKCASLIGIGLYLWAKAPPAIPFDRGQTPESGSGRSSTTSSGAGGSSTGAASSDLDALYCEECSEPLTETRFKDGTNWAPAQLAVFGRRKHGKILCMRDYREYNNAKRRAEEALQSVPF